MTRVVFDTNIYISGLLFRGLPRQLLVLASQNRFRLYISLDILNEINSVLIKKFGFSASRAQQATVFIRSLCKLVYPTKTIKIIKNCPADNRILECCQKAGANFLVSGDRKHLLPLKAFQGTEILSAADFLKSV